MTEFVKVLMLSLINPKWQRKHPLITLLYLYTYFHGPVSELTTGGDQTLFYFVFFLSLLMIALGIHNTERNKLVAQSEQLDH